MIGKWKQSFSLCLALLFALAVGVEAQTAETGQSQLPASVVTASLAGEQARFTAPAGVAQMRLEVFTTAGEKVFDSDFRPGNLLDWPLQDQQGQHLADGAYRCVITTRDLTGRLAQKRGEVRMQAGAAAFEEAGDETQTIQENGSSNVMSREAFLAILRDGVTRATAVLAHDGDKGRLVSGSGGLSFRVGDFFAGKDVERMRLTPEGNLGIGLSNPLARLDVAGMIRTGEGIMFPDGTIQTTAANPETQTGAANGSGDPGATTTASRNVPNAAADSPIYGTGTMNRLAKFAGINAIGDSLISEIGGNIGVGTPNPKDKLHVSGGGLRLDNNHGLFLSDAAGAARRVLLIDPSNTLHIGSGAPLGVNRIDFDLGSAGNVMTVNGGNVGIGTANPQDKLHVTGGGLRLDNNRGLFLSDASGAAKRALLVDPSNILRVGSGGSQGVNRIDFDLGTAGTVMTLLSNGNLNIGGNALLGNNLGIFVKNKSGADKRVLLADTANILHIGAGGGQGFDRIDFDLGTAGNVMTLLSNGNLNIGGNALLGNNLGMFMKNASGADKRVLLADTANILHIGSGGGQGFDRIDFDLGTTGNVMTLVDGRVKVPILQITGGADLSEQFEVKAAPDSYSEASSQQVQPGLVVSIDSDNPGKLVVSSRAYDRRVAGIISGAGGVSTGMLMSQAGSIADGSHPVALTGRVYCWADSSNGPIEPGDLLTSSNIPGHAMKVTDHTKAQGAIIGKAMTALKEGKGLVLALVSLQ